MLKLTNHPLVKASNNYTQHNWMIARKKDNLSFADYYHWGNRFYEIRKYELAIENFSQAIKKDSTYTEAHINRANAIS
ncbi:hypothetical protein RINTHH_17540 [Richelia intracellularis HH01]|jgi:tetratricopeptide (TPR) repeat protein|uniref:Uncharacterized protein n=1 Tax=Richelia intracellularis HH01 TaxID=1165094 RepID=M1WT86_9NOST|nr:tetratricopeptide repeat protein [Richelia intracellularis]CCH67909.1 hypothetical protein RINTHH_17540 [Richelia intracellularis HH01]